MFPDIPDLLVDVFRTWKRGARRARVAIIISTFIGAVGGVLLLMANTRMISYSFGTVVGAVLVGGAFLSLTGVAAFERSIKQEQAEVRVLQVEERFREN